MRSRSVASVSPITRRIFWYWVLLLVPTLAVGAGALLLLRREQARVAAQSETAREAQRAAMEARARLVAENVELLVGDVQAGLLDVLGEAPEGDIDAFLDHWEKTNPLVRLTFRAAADGRILRPAANVVDEEAKGFMRRFGRTLRERTPWATASAQPAPAPAAPAVTQQALDEAEVRQKVAANVSNFQSARRDVQELFKVREQSAGAAAPAAAASADYNEAKARAARTRPAPSSERAEGNAVELQGFSTGTGARADSVAPEVTSSSKKTEAGADRRGWAPLTIDGRMHLLAWLQPGGHGEVRGVEIETAALISRLAGSLPADVLGGEGYAIRDAGARVLHQVGVVSRSSEPQLRVPLSANLLPGWDVVAFVVSEPARGTFTIGFFWVAGAIMAGLVLAILSGGSLLLWQARRSAEEAALKTSFVANVSHEFKTPLTTIRLYSELLEQGRVRDQAQGREYLRTIGRETQRLARLVNNALDFSRLEQGRKKFAREEVDVGAEMSRLLETHRPRVAEAGLQLHYVAPSTPVRAMADRDALEQIVLNVVDNACKYAASGGEVSVHVRARERGAEVRIGDRGPGVPEEHRELIFEKFHRVDDALTAEKSGTGLGLSIARQLARGMGGDLRHEPRAGGGAEFVLELP